MSKLTIKSQKPLSMTSLEIADLTGKLHKNVIRDITKILCELYEIKKDGSNLSHKLKQYVTKIECDDRGYTSLIELDEELTLTITSGYSVKQRNTIIRQWQLMRNTLEATRYHLNHTATQLNAMAVIHDHLPIKEQSNSVNYIKANCVVAKIVSTLHGHPKMIKKSAMTTQMLIDHNVLMADYVKLFELGFDNHRVKQLLHEMYLTKEVAA